MESLEALEQRKKELLLRKEIAKLESQERTDGQLAKFSSWWIVVPVGVIGALLFLGGIQEGAPQAILPGLAMIGAAVTLRVRGTRRG